MQYRPLLRRWFCVWGLSHTADHVKVEWSADLGRKFGICHQAERRIVLAVSLKGSQKGLFREILCHEAAHIAIYELYDDVARHHGKEWKALIRQVNFVPRAVVPIRVRAK